MSIVEDLLFPISFEDFRREFFFRKPFAAPNKACRFRKLISWPLLSEILESGYGDCWLPIAGRLPDEATGSLRIENAMHAFNEGRTVLIRHSECSHPALKNIADDFAAFFGDPIDIQIYATPPGEEGFDWHYDIEEVFVIQSSGEKEFRLKIPRELPPLNRVVLPKSLDFNRDFIGGEIRCHLKAGDWLYIPAGVWHKARAITPSFHLSVGVMSSGRSR